MPRVELPAHACAIFSVCWDWHHQLHALFNCNQLNRLKSIPHTDCSGTCQETLQLLQAPNSQTVAAGRQKYSCLISRLSIVSFCNVKLCFPLILNTQLLLNHLELFMNSTGVVALCGMLRGRTMLSYIYSLAMLQRYELGGCSIGASDCMTCHDCD